jgi:hypothetical protein
MDNIFKKLNEGFWMKSSNGIVRQDVFTNSIFYLMAHNFKSGKFELVTTLSKEQVEKIAQGENISFI